MERSGEEIEATGQGLLEVGEGLFLTVAQGVTRHEADSCGGRIIDCLPIRSEPEELLLPYAAHGLADQLGVAGNPVEIGHAEAGLGGDGAGALVFIGKGPYRFAFFFLLAGDGQGFGGVETGNDHIMAGIKEAAGNEGRVGGDSGDIEPETDPADFKF